MRVIGGQFRSRRLKGPPGLHVRPTPDRLRETLFDILAPRISGALFVDAYAGSGAVGIEALSRGAREAVFIERSRTAAAVIRDNLASLGLEPRAQLIVGKTLAVLPRLSPDIVFLDPPYDLAAEYDAALRLLGESAAPPLAIAQHTTRLRLRDRYGALRLARALKQGDNALSFFEPAPVQ